MMVIVNLNYRTGAKRPIQCAVFASLIEIGRFAVVKCTWGHNERRVLDTYSEWQNRRE